MTKNESESGAKSLLATADDLKKDAAAKTEEAAKSVSDAYTEYLKATSAYSLAGANYALGQISADDYSRIVEPLVKAAEVWTRKQHWTDAANLLLQSSAARLYAAQMQFQFGQSGQAEEIARGAIDALKVSIRYAESALA